MIHDALAFLPAELEAEVCIVGAGPAGIVLALELARRGRQVVLLEGGGIDSPGDGESIYQGESSGRPYPLYGSRLRWLGGTSNHWGGWVKPLDDVDFDEKSHYPLPGWPIGLAELEPWYRVAARWCEIESDDFDPKRLQSAADGRLLPLDDRFGFVHRMFRFSPPTRFGQRYREALENEARVDCRVNLNAVSLEQGDGRIRALATRTLAGETCRVRAERFVLAMGGIENARFLLNQLEIPGNQADLVGRCFMDHYGFSPGRMLGNSRLAYERGALPGRDVMIVLAPARTLMQEAGLRNSCLMLSADSPDPVLGTGYWASPLLGGHEGAIRRIVMINEPLPHPQSRITLGDATDVLGLKRARLHWHLPVEEFTPVLDLFRRWSADVAAAGMGRIRIQRTAAPEPGEHVGIGYHHMGTTRMSASPEFGVVDPDGRCWDRENLYLAGSSLFPHVGYSNPTLTIVALAARLADHLAGDNGGKA